MAHQYRGRIATTPQDKLKSIKFHTRNCSNSKQPCKIAEDHYSHWNGIPKIYDKEFGQKSIGKVILYLHEEITFKELNDPKIFARHVCDNPLCFEATHLLKGNAASNADDSVVRHRRPCIFSRRQVRFIYQLFFQKNIMPVEIQQHPFLRYQIRGDNPPFKLQSPSVMTICNYIINKNKTFKGFRRNWMTSKGITDPYAG